MEISKINKFQDILKNLLHIYKISTWVGIFLKINVLILKLQCMW